MTGRNKEDGIQKLNELKSMYPTMNLKFMLLEIGNTCKFIKTLNKYFFSLKF